jgi:assimilatory nitrate reductase catalytic subunit
VLANTILIILKGTFSCQLHIHGDKSHSANFGRLCSKGGALASTLNLDGRLLFPEINGESCSWNTALNKIATEFQSIINQYGSDAIAFYVSGQLLTEDYYVANKFMKGFIGTANIDTNFLYYMQTDITV